ncbi:MAG: Uncharacterized MFS-type transporter, partial [uncultured Thermomicrobiales bacterium]
ARLRPRETGDSTAADVAFSSSGFPDSIGCCARGEPLDFNRSRSTTLAPGRSLGRGTGDDGRVGRGEAQRHGRRGDRGERAAGGNRCRRTVESGVAAPHRRVAAERRRRRLRSACHCDGDAARRRRAPGPGALRLGLQRLPPGQPRRHRRRRAPRRRPRSGGALRLGRRPLRGRVDSGRPGANDVGPGRRPCPPGIRRRRPRLDRLRRGRPRLPGCRPAADAGLPLDRVGGARADRPRPRRPRRRGTRLALGVPRPRPPAGHRGDAGAAGPAPDPGRFGAWGGGSAGGPGGGTGGRGRPAAGRAFPARSPPRRAVDRRRPGAGPATSRPPAARGNPIRQTGAAGRDRDDGAAQPRLLRRRGLHPLGAGRPPRQLHPVRQPDADRGDHHLDQRLLAPGPPGRLRSPPAAGAGRSCPADDRRRRHHSPALAGGPARAGADRLGHRRDRHGPRLLDHLPLRPGDRPDGAGGRSLGLAATGKHARQRARCRYRRGPDRHLWPGRGVAPGADGPERGDDRGPPAGPAGRRGVASHPRRGGRRATSRV